MPEGRGNKKSGILGAVIVWAIGLAVSIGLGTISDMFLSPEALKSAISFQQSALNAVSSFTPHRLIDQIDQMNASFPDKSMSAIPRALAYIRELQERESQLSMVPGSIFSSLAIISFIMMAVVFIGLVLSLFDKTTKAGPKLNLLMSAPLIVGLAGALTFTVLIVVVSVALGVLKWTALAALFAFGWLTSLAGIFAIAGTVSSAGYFVIVKASEKRIGEAAERVASRLIERK